MARDRGTEPRRGVTALAPAQCISAGSHLLLGQFDKPEDALQVWPVDEGAHPGILQKGVPEFYPLGLFHHFCGKSVENFLLHKHPRAVAANLRDKHTCMSVARRQTEIHQLYTHPPAEEDRACGCGHTALWHKVSAPRDESSLCLSVSV